MKKLIYSNLLKFFLKLDNWVYGCISKLVVRLHNGIHPKHHIIRYEDWFLEQIGPQDCVLDIGSHDGTMCLVLAQKAMKVLGIEIEEPKYRKAIKQNTANNVKFVLGDATSLKLEERFNIVTLSNVLEHVDKRVEFLKRILIQHRPEKVLIRVPLITREWLSVYKKSVGIDYRLDPTHFTEYTEEELRSEISAAGLNIKSFEIKFGEAFLVCLT